MMVKIKLLDYIENCKLHIMHNIALTGHTYYRSPYECYDDCGTCDGARCDYCSEIDEFNLCDVSMDKHYFMKMIRNEISKQEAYVPDYSTLEKWYDQFNEWLCTINKEENEIIEFNYLKLKMEIVSFTMSDIESYKNYLLDEVYVVIFRNKSTPALLYTSSKDFAKKIEKSFDWAYVDTVHRYDLKGDEIFIKEDN